MGRVGRPPSLDAPPCPACGTGEDVASHGIQEVNGDPKRAFRCKTCSRVFVPGHADDQPTPALKAALRRVRSQTEAPYRLMSNALSTHLGIEASHTTVRAWCTDDDPTDPVDEEALACEYLSVLWALRHEIQAEAGE